jgi:hypothetical protein
MRDTARTHHVACVISGYIAEALDNREKRILPIGYETVKGREVASKTSDLAGDGTTTATVLDASIMKEGIKLVVAGMNPIDLKRGIDIAVSAVVKDVERRSKKVQSYKEVAQVGMGGMDSNRSIETTWTDLKRGSQRCGPVPVIGTSIQGAGIEACDTPNEGCPFCAALELADACRLIFDQECRQALDEMPAPAQEAVVVPRGWVSVCGSVC